eukprot:gnl/TRDRNA2_/TRDRNA2_73363_c0_seq1.p1 gnl/TRDRNA2_/TRDRNA2_73363_c0~~gnl/TRDRNA2_/TRDRNA2_73363_c0_seq1.p1  ORF type:complete len:388 (+),score=55.25 gnl/TRDRNA2_/TRDRNA2_73363_c0_seq1:114-1277(+)
MEVSNSWQFSTWPGWLFVVTCLVSGFVVAHFVRILIRRRCAEARSTGLLSVHSWRLLHIASVGRELEHHVFHGKDELKVHLKRMVLSFLTHIPSGLKLAAADGDGRVRIMDVATLKLERELPHRGRVLTTAWSPSGRLLATGTCRGTLYLFDAGSMFAQQEIRLGHWLCTVSWDPCGLRLAAGSRNHQAYILDVATFSVDRTVDGESPVASVAWSAGGCLLAVGGEDGGIRVFKADTAALQWKVMHLSRVRSVAWDLSKADGLLAVSGDDGNVRIFNAEGQLDFQLRLNGMIRSVAWSPSGSTLAAAGAAGVVNLFNRAEAFSNSSSNLVPAGKEISVVAWQPSSENLAVVFSDDLESQLHIMDTKTWQVYSRLRLGDWTWGIDWNP